MRLLIWIMLQITISWQINVTRSLVKEDRYFWSSSVLSRSDSATILSTSGFIINLHKGIYRWYTDSKRYSKINAVCCQRQKALRHCSVTLNVTFENAVRKLKTYLCHTST